MLCNQGNGSSLVPMDLPILTPQVPQPEITTGLDVTGSSHQFLAEASSSHSTSYTRPGSGGGNLPGIMPVCPSELGITHPINRDGLRQHNIDGIAEILLALERIEQDEELTYEQLLALETNLLLGGFGFYDQHRDMRLDIDNMSYEEAYVVISEECQEKDTQSLWCSMMYQKVRECIRIKNVNGECMHEMDCG